MNKLKRMGNNKGSSKSNLKYREGNTVDFNLINITRVAKIYNLEIKQINDSTVQIINNKRKSVWFMFNHDNKYLELRHKNQGAENIHSHHQRDFYDVEFCLKSIVTHECYKENNSDYRNTGIGRMFSMIENNKQKYIKIS